MTLAPGGDRFPRAAENGAAQPFLIGARNVERKPCGRAADPIGGYAGARSSFIGSTGFPSAPGALRLPPRPAVVPAPSSPPPASRRPGTPPQRPLIQTENTHIRSLE